MSTNEPPTSGRRPLDNPLSARNLEIGLRNAQESPLLRLPAELRNHIYDYVLGGTEIRLGKPHGEICDGCQLQLLYVCRQIFHEARYLPFELNTFVLGPCCQGNFLPNIFQRQCRFIRKIRINVLILEPLPHDYLSYCFEPCEYRPNLKCLSNLQTAEIVLITGNFAPILAKRSITEILEDAGVFYSTYCKMIRGNHFEGIECTRKEEYKREYAGWFKKWLGGHVKLSFVFSTETADFKMMSPDHELTEELTLSDLVLE